MRVQHILKNSVAFALLLAVAACANPRVDHTGSLPDDHRVRHPINVTRGAATLDLLPGGGPGGMTNRQVGDVQSFARDWQKRGRGQLAINVPTGGDPITDGQSAHAAKEIRRIFGAMGIPGNAIVTQRYAADGPQHLAPVRLEFPVLEAKLPHECGQWPDDMGFMDPGSSNRNQSYWNFGCAHQQNLAAQIEDPEDLIRPRAEEPAMARRRTEAIEKFAKGEPTVTSYPDPKMQTRDE